MLETSEFNNINPENEIIQTFIRHLSKTEQYLYNINPLFKDNNKCTSTLVNSIFSISNNLYSIGFNTKNNTLTLKNKYAEISLTKIHRLSNNENCLRIYLKIPSEGATIKIDTDAELNPLSWSSDLYDEKKSINLEKLINRKKKLSYKALIIDGEKLCNKYIGSLPEKLSIINNLTR